MEVQGKIKLIYETKTYGKNNFKKREMVLTTEEQYPQFLLIEFVQDKTSLLDNFQEGQQVKIDVDLRGREWINPEGEAKYFNSIQGWRIHAVEEQPASDIPPVPPAEAFEPAGTDELDEKAHDDLPF